METNTTVISRDARTTKMFTNKVVAFAASASMLIAVSVLLMATSVSAQPGPGTTCTGDNTTTFGSDYYGFEDFGNRLFSTTTTSRDFALATPLEAGTYALDAVSYDGYPNRSETTGQSREQWFAELLAADGTVLATSGVTGDLEDGVDEATWNGSLGEVTIDQTATTVRVQHASPGSPEINSVRPVCVGATGGPDDPAPAPSDITVIYTSSDAPNATVVATCGALEESVIGTTMVFSINDLPAGAECTVTYPSDLTCSVDIGPADLTGVADNGVASVQIPVAGGASIIVDIDCVGTAVAAPTTTTTTIETEVGGQVEAPAIAPTAQVQPGSPAFTG